MTPARERLREACHRVQWIPAIDWSIHAVEGGYELRAKVKNAAGEVLNCKQRFSEKGLTEASDNALEAAVYGYAIDWGRYAQLLIPSGPVIKVDREKCTVTVQLDKVSIHTVEKGQEFRLR